MLESTLTAFYSSFRAVLGVADQFSRLRTQLYNILGTVAALKTLRWMLHKLAVACTHTHT
jgi:peroxin-13